MKDLGVKPYMFPMPVGMIATYNEDGSVDVMNMAWGGVCGDNLVALNLDEGHKTSENIKRTGAFTLSIPDVAHVKEADYFGIASANDVKDKFERTGLTAERSSRVDAPVVMEFPVTLECKVAEIQHGRLRIRYLTPRECWRLMGQPDWAYDRVVAAGTPKTHLYKQAGNSIVVDVLEAIFKGMYIDQTWEDTKPKRRLVTLDDFGGDE